MHRISIRNYEYDTILHIFLNTHCRSLYNKLYFRKFIFPFLCFICYSCYYFLLLYFFFINFAKIDCKRIVLSFLILKKKNLSPFPFILCVYITHCPIFHGFMLGNTSIYVCIYAEYEWLKVSSDYLTFHCCCNTIFWYPTPTNVCNKFDTEYGVLVL